jgi:hypothetical protein
MASSGMLRRVALVRTDVSEELSASFIRVTRIGELGTTLTLTSNRRTLLLCNIQMYICFKLMDRPISRFVLKSSDCHFILSSVRPEFL